MSSRVLFLSAATLVCFNLFASAQIDSESMDDLDAWGAGYLGAGEPEFPTTLWAGSDDITLLDLMQALDPAEMTQSERGLLRRIILSPTRKPESDLSDEMLIERTRLILALGEADAAAALAPHLSEAGAVLEADTMQIDLNLARGNEASACRQLTSLQTTGDYWLKLRAVCAVLQGNYSGAELAVEFASAQGLDDPWFVEAVFAASGDASRPPIARYDSGLNIALSLHADLATEGPGPSLVQPALAAAAATHPRLPKLLRQTFAGLAREHEKISGKAYRQILSENLSDPDYTVTTEIELALQTLDDPIALVDEQLDNLSLALDQAAQGDLAHYTAIASLFEPDLKRFAERSEMAPYVLTFAKAALAMGDGDLALRWLRTNNIEPDEPLDPFEVARLEILALWLGADVGEGAHQLIQAQLVEAALTEDQSIIAADLLAVSAGLGHTLDKQARAVLHAYNGNDNQLPPYRRLGLEAAVRSGAIGEAALLLLAETRGEPEALSSADIAVLVSILQSIDAEDTALALALEASQFWHSDIGSTP